MTDDKEAEPDGLPDDQPEPPAIPNDPPARSGPTRRDNSEKGIGLEMARLFGISPKLMMAPKSPPKERAEADDGGSDDDEESGPSA